MIKHILTAIEQDSVIVPIAKTWFLGIITLWIGMSDVQAALAAVTAIMVIVYTWVKILNGLEDLKSKRKNNGKPDGN